MPQQDWWAPLGFGVFIPRTMNHQGRLEWEGRVKAWSHTEALHRPEARTRAPGKGRGAAMETERRWTGLGAGGDMRARRAVCPGSSSGSGQGISGTILELRTQEALQGNSQTSILVSMTSHSDK